MRCNSEDLRRIGETGEPGPEQQSQAQKSAVPRSAGALLPVWLGAQVVAMLLVQCLPTLPPVLPCALPGIALCPLLWRWAARCGGDRSQIAAAPGASVLALSTVASGVLLGVAVAAWHGQRLLDARLADHCEREPLVLRGVVAERPRTGGSGDRHWQRLTLEVRALSPQRCAGPRRALLTLYEARPLQPGELWEFQVVPRVPWGTANPAGFNAAAWYARSGIDMVGSIRSGSAHRVRTASGLVGLHQRLRAQLADAISARLDDPGAAALLRALVVGERSAIDEAVWRQLQHWGITHLLVISGLHIALVAAAGVLLGSALGRVGLLLGWAHALRWCPALCGLCGALGYSALAGFTVPTVRALIMSGCFLLALVSGRQARSGRNLLYAVWLLLLLNPLQSLGSGFWLSAGAVAALLWLLGWSGPLPRWRAALRVHGFMALLMLPASAWWFQGGSLLSLPANLLAAPLVGFWVVPVALLGSALFWLAPAFSVLCWQAASWPLLHLLDTFAGPGAALARWGYITLSPAGMAVCLALLAALMQALPLAPGMRLASVALLLPLLLADRAAPPWLARLTVLDVGQGTAVVLRSAQHTLVYDTGGGDPAGANHGTRTLLPFLRQQGIDRIDDLVISHADTDHSAGTRALLEAVPVARIHLGEPLPAAPQGRPCRAGRRWRWDSGVEFTTLTTSRPGQLEGNAASCVLMAVVHGRRFLLTGDLGVEGERELVRYWGDALRADWLLVGHHGSATSTASAFLRRVQPRFAVLSHARANAFGHPHPQVLRRLCRSGATVHATAERGALHYTVDREGRITVHAERDGYQPYWAGRATPARNRCLTG